MDESKSARLTVSYMPETTTSNVVLQGSSEVEIHCQQAEEKGLVVHRLTRNSLENQGGEQESDHMSEEQLSGYEWDEQRHSVSDQNYLGDLSGSTSGSVASLDTLVRSEPRHSKPDSKSNGGRMISTHEKTTGTVTSQLIPSTGLNEAVSKIFDLIYWVHIFILHGSLNLFQRQPIPEEVLIKIHVLRLSATDLKVAAVILTMLCVIGIFNPLALCFTLPAYYCATKV